MWHDIKSCLQVAQRPELLDVLKYTELSFELKTRSSLWVPVCVYLCLVSISGIVEMFRHMKVFPCHQHLQPVQCLCKQKKVIATLRFRNKA